MKTVYIVGMGSTMIKCDYSEDVEIWSMNMAYRVCKRIDKLFLTDPRYNFSGKPNHNWEEINSLDIPVVSLHQFPELKNLIPYPYEYLW